MLTRAGSGSTGRSSSFRNSRVSFKETSGPASDMTIARDDTLVSLFLSGKSHQSIGPAPSTGDSSQGLAEKSAALLSDWAGAEFDYFPEPPCIGTNEEEDEDEVVIGDDQKVAIGMNPQEYWKSQVSLQTWTPAQKADAEKADLYVSLLIGSAGPAVVWERGISTDRVDKIKTNKDQASFTELAGGTESVYFESFVNVSLCKVGIRSCASSSDGFKTNETVDPGEAVVIKQIVEDEGTRYLRLQDDRGWVFDWKDGVQVLAKMEDVEVGLSWYRVVSQHLMSIRRAPVYDEAAKTECFLCPQELVVVNMKAKVCGSFFVHLADGRGWCFVQKRVEGRKAYATSNKTSPDDGGLLLEECEGEIVAGNRESNQFGIPTTSDVVEVGNWTYCVGYDPVLALGLHPHGKIIAPGEVVVVNKRCYVKGDVPEDKEVPRWWLRLADDRGWIPERSPAGELLVTLRKSGEANYPRHYKGKRDERVEANWMMGVA